MSSQKETETREKWGSKAEFVLSLIGLSVGLGNVWRFPAMAYYNGGGAFVIAYFTINLLVGLPGYILELGLGQFIGKSPTCVFEMAPFWRGLGWSMTMIPFYVTLYYNVIMAWVLHFLFASFRSKLNWNLCTNFWNDDSCIDRNTVLGVETRSIKNNVSIIYCNQNTSELFLNCTRGVFATSQYFNKYVLGISDSIDNYGLPRWSIVLCLLLAWILVCLCLLFGVKSSGKVVYVTATFPYLVLVILLIRGATLDGSLNGILYYIKPDFNLLFSLNIWYQAANQVFYSLGLGFGSLIMYSSLNEFNNNFIRDAAIVTVADAFTSTIGGFTVFSILGFLSHSNKIPIDQIVEAGTGLAFVIYPEALANMPLGPLFSILFFLMLFSLGIDSQFGMTETCIRSVQDYFKISPRYRPLLVIGYSCIMFILGLSFCCPGGFYMFELIVNFSGAQALIAIGFLEFIVVVYIYGYNNYMEDIKMMLKKRYCEGYFFATWCLISPIIILMILIFMSLNTTVMVVNGKPLPNWSIFIGWLIVASILIPIPLFAIYELYKGFKIRSYLKRNDMPLYLTILKFVNKPTRRWRPFDKQNQIDRYQPEKQTIDINKILNGMKFEENLGFDCVESHRF